MTDTMATRTAKLMALDRRSGECAACAKDSSPPPALTGMKNVILGATLITLLGIPSQGAERRQRYLVATTTAGAKTAPFSYDDRELAIRGFTRFSSVEGYSIELTDAEAQTLSRRPDVRYVEP